MTRKRVELAERRAAVPEAALERLAAEALPPRDVVAALEPDRLGVIAEVKRASPSKGAIALDLDAVTQARRYAEGGADAISVLTDEEFYHGSLDDLRAIRAAVPTPVLRKDFILDRYGLLEARAAGADLVLLIVAALAIGPQGRSALSTLVDEARALGLTPLVEVYTAEEARVALEIGAEGVCNTPLLVGINNRNLHTFEVSLETTERLAPLLVRHALVVSLSGMSSAADARRAVAAGARAVLVGEALVRTDDPAALIRELKSIPIAAGRGVVSLPNTGDRRQATGDRTDVPPTASPTGAKPPRAAHVRGRLSPGAE
jgi:indole-3-glycerol phosphate synthase